MAFSSLLFGGLSLWHARKGKTEGLDAEGIHSFQDSFLNSLSLQVQHFLEWHHLALFRFAVFVQSIDPRTFAWLMSTLCLLVLLAYSTNPGDTSFRSYLTELSLHQHLHQLRQETPIRQDHLTEEQLEGVTRIESEKGSSPHILTFANRISVSLRTPRYERRDYGMFCTVTVPCTPLFRGGLAHRQGVPSISTRYVGAFGKWWASGLVKTPKPSAERQGKHVNGRIQESWGVMRMKAGETQEDEESSGTDKASTGKKAVSAGTAASKGLLNGQVSDGSQWQSGKPSGRRKKQAQKAKPTPIIAESETSTGDSKASEELMSAVNGINTPARLLETPEKTSESEQHSPAAASASSTTFDVNGIAVDIQAQLEQVRLASESSKKQLQGQLEELRSRKRDEDAARLDVKGRMKTLDESKRHAEGTKREAERRLKAANGLREAIENKIQAKVQEMKDWKAKEAAQEIKIQQSGERKTSKIAEMRLEIQRKEQESQDAEEELEQLKAKLDMLHQRLLEEEANLEAATELAAERDAAAFSNRSFPGSSSHYHNAYPLLSGPGELSDQSIGDMQMDCLYGTWNADGQGYHPYGPAPGSGVPMTSDDIKEDIDETFDPTIVSSHLEPHSAFAPFSFDQSTLQHNLMQSQSAKQTSMPSLFGEVANAPPTPFTSDLLPSNLFQNADDDERHVGVLPGSRSEQVEAALNRFGLDTSDTSDVEGSGEDVVGEVKDGRGVGTKEEGEEQGEIEEDSARVESGIARPASRSWWNVRSRNASKDRSSSNSSNLAALTGMDNRIPLATSSSDAVMDTPPQEATKRISLSIFPKLSLNPGAKSFRGASKKVDTERSFADYDDAAVQAVWSNSTGQMPTRQDFETMKRAFQTNNLAAAEQDEDEGRKSWSAFDTWQQQQQFRHSNASLTAINTVGRPMSNFPSHLNSSMYHNQRASSESLAQARRIPGASTSPQSTATWLDDVFTPLHKSHSIDDAISSASSSSMPRSSHRVGKPSRFAFWANNSTAAAPSQSATTTSSSAISPEEGLVGGGTDTSSTAPSLQQSSSSTSATPQPTKRSSFRWNRRQDSSSLDVQALSQKVKEQE